MGRGAGSPRPMPMALVCKGQKDQRIEGNGGTGRFAGHRIKKNCAVPQIVLVDTNLYKNSKILLTGCFLFPYYFYNLEE
jgi:hypothetical protein